MGRGVDASDMRRRLRECAVPRGYVHVADLDVEFTSNASSARTSNMSGMPYQVSNALKCRYGGPPSPGGFISNEDRCNRLFG